MNNDVCAIILADDTLINGEQFSLPGNAGAVRSVRRITYIFSARKLEKYSLRLHAALKIFV
jgi:hypothetical protein